MTPDWSIVQRRGLCVFPLLPNSKRPAVEWDRYKLGERATADTMQTWIAAGYQPAVATNTITVFEVDSLEAWARALEMGLPDTFTVKTPRGWHYYFQHPGWAVSNRAGSLRLDGERVDGWDVRGDKGYVVGPGSYYVPTADEAAKGKVEGAYTVELDVPPAPLPVWLAELLVRPEPSSAVAPRIADETSPWGLKALHGCLADLTAAVDGAVNQTVNNVAFRVAQAVAGGEIVAQEALDALYEGLAARGIGGEAKALETLQRGWDAGLLAPRAGPEPLDPIEVFGAQPAVFVPSDVPDPPTTERTQRRLTLTLDQLGDKTSHLNIEYWIAASGALIRYDEFASVVRVGEHALTDHLERQIWLGIREASSLAFAWDLFGHTIRGMAWANRYHPLRQYLDGVQPAWDGTGRIDGWLTRYLGVAANDYTTAVGALFLTALVRRVRQPGAKFDEMLVLEGPQGIEKSSALGALCPDETWFTDEASVGMTSKELLEITGGKWIVEAPELKGMAGRGVDHVKAFLSRRYDKARMAFERNTTERGREWVAAATTNDSQYLDDPTGNRRVWPVVVTAVDLAGIRGDRDQLWAEACQREASGASIRMPQHLWQAAADVQAERVLHDSMKEALDELLGGRTGRVKGKVVLDALRVPFERQAAMSRKFGEAMRSLGWENKPVKVDGKAQRFFVKGDPARSIIYSAGNLDYEQPDLRVM